MKNTSRLWAVALIVFGVGFGIYAFKPSDTTAQPAAAAQPAGGSARYDVIDTEGTNIIVTDHATNTLYFYTVDPEKPAGDPLKLRASLDLSQVGKPVMTPKVAGK